METQKQQQTDGENYLSLFTSPNYLPILAKKPLSLPGSASCFGIAAWSFLQGCDWLMTSYWIPMREGDNSKAYPIAMLNMLCTP